MDWDKKVCGFGLAGWVRARSFFDRINRIKEDEEDKMIFISYPFNPLNFVNPDNEKGPRQTSMGWGKSFWFMVSGFWLDERGDFPAL
jgi:hypothetical protein